MPPLKFELDFAQEDLTITIGDGHGHLQSFTVPEMSYVAWDLNFNQDYPWWRTLFGYLQATWGFTCAPYLQPLNTTNTATGNATIGMV